MRKYSPQEIAQAIVRRRWLILVPFALGVAAVPILATYAPARYRSDALIVVIPQRVSHEYVKPTVGQSVEDRLPSLTDQILSRAKLELIITELDLYRDERQRGLMQDAVDRMKADVKTTAAGKDVDSFRVSYVSDDPEKAQKVTAKVSNLYVEQNNQDRQQQADNTSDFFANQLEAAKTRLQEHEKKLELYNKTNAGTLPSQLQGNLQAIQNANMQLQAVNDSMNRAQERRLFIDQQMADAQASLAAAALPPVTALPETAAAPTSTAQQLALARGRLTQLLQRYTPDHPDVVSQERTVAELSLRLEAEAPVSTPVGTEKPLNPAEAAAQKKLRELEAERLVVDHQIAGANAERTRLKQTIADYQAKVDALPTRESELVELTRDYSTIQMAYTNLLMKREDSQLAASLERRKIGEEFRVVDPASTPTRPYNQRQRLTIIASGAMAGLALGLLAVAFLEIRDSSFRSSDEVVKSLSLPVLASIPDMVSGQERQATKRRIWALDIVTSVLLAAAGVVLVIWRFRL